MINNIKVTPPGDIILDYFYTQGDYSWTVKD